ncbi:hypothetical protein U1Q18_006065 [Sarracenia purpurea var. burkii]
MRFEMGMEPNEVTLISTISACIDTGAVDEGKYIHGLAMKIGLLSATKVLNALINMYGKFGYLDLASQLFKAVPMPNLVSWNSVVAIHIQNGFPGEGFDIFKSMRRAGVKADRATMVSLLHGCADLGLGRLAAAIHGYIFICGLESDLTVSTSLLRFYAKSGGLNDSYDVFKEMENPDRIAWTAMLAGYAMHGEGRGAIELFEAMVKKEANLSASPIIGMGACHFDSTLISQSVCPKNSIHRLAYGCNLEIDELQMRKAILVCDVISMNLIFL